MKKKNGNYLLLILICYLIVVFWLLFLQVGSTDRASYFDSRRIHIIPFESSFNSIKLALNNNFATQHKQHYRYITLRNFAGNILLFLPWGFLAPLIFPRFQKSVGIFISTAIFSITAEIAQFIFIVGVADIDDVLLNLLGALIGFYVYSFLNLRTSFVKKISLPWMD